MTADNRYGLGGLVGLLEDPCTMLRCSVCSCLCSPEAWGFVCTLPSDFIHPMQVGMLDGLFSMVILFVQYLFGPMSMCLPGGREGSPCTSNTVLDCLSCPFVVCRKVWSGWPHMQLIEVCPMHAIQSSAGG